jgi:hypothetical protein
MLFFGCMDGRGVLGWVELILNGTQSFCSCGLSSTFEFDYQQNQHLGKTVLVNEGTVHSQPLFKPWGETSGV